MDFSNLISNLLSKKLVTARTADGTTYGPAESLVTHTPITYGSLPGAGYAGDFNPQTNTIKIDPSKGNVSQITKHEQVHALLNRLPNAGVAQTQSAPGYQNIATRLNGTVQGNLPDEVPAYMAQSPTSQTYGVSDAQRNAYMQGLVGQLQKLDPTIAAKLQRLSQ